MDEPLTGFSKAQLAVLKSLSVEQRAELLGPAQSDADKAPRKPPAEEAWERLVV
jgi:hypothetical protein